MVMKEKHFKRNLKVCRAVHLQAPPLTVSPELKQADIYSERFGFQTFFPGNSNPQVLHMSRVSRQTYHNYHICSVILYNVQSKVPKIP